MNDPIVTYYRDIYFSHLEGNYEFVVYFDGCDWVVLSPLIELYGRKCKHVVGRKDGNSDGFENAVELAKQLNNLLNKVIK